MKITTLAQLEKAAKDRKCVSSGYRYMRTPAAFVLAMPFREVFLMMQSGMYICKPKSKLKPVYHRKLLTLKTP